MALRDHLLALSALCAMAACRETLPDVAATSSAPSPTDTSVVSSPPRQLTSAERATEGRRLYINHTYVERAVELLSSACDAGVEDGCAGLAEYEIDHGRDNRGAERARLACERGSSYGCVVLGRAYAWGEGVPEDRAAGVEILGRECDAGELYGCDVLGDVYTDIDDDGLDHAKGVELYRRACDGGFVGGCASLGLEYYFGVSLEKDRAKARELYERACAAEYMVGCSWLATLLLEADVPDARRARQLFETTCSHGNSCDALATLLVDGTGGPADRPRSFALLEAACKRDVAVCARVVDALERGVGTQVDRLRAERVHAEMITRCAGRCAHIGFAFLNGRNVEKDVARAVAVFEHACAQNEGPACFMLGGLHARGIDLPEDRSRAREWYTKACALGEAAACSKP